MKCKKCHGRITEKNNRIGCERCKTYSNHKAICYRCDQVLDETEGFYMVAMTPFGNFQTGPRAGENKCWMLIRCEACQFEIEHYRNKAAIALKNLDSVITEVDKTNAKAEQEIDAFYKSQTILDIWKLYNDGGFCR